nr:hypothetical protein [Tanacetum cinerariifolium]
KKDVIQYTRFTKLIIADLMKKFPSITQRLEEDYHSIKDDILLEYKEYEKVFVKVDVPTIQPQPVKSTQGTIRTPSAQRTPTPTAIVGDVVHKKRKRKQVARDISSPKPSLKIRVKQIKPTKIAEKQENMVIAQEKLMEEDVEKIVYGGDEESYAYADHVGCLDTCKSTSSEIQFLGDKLVSWSSKKPRLHRDVNCRSRRLEEDYHSIKDDILLVSVYTTGNVIVRVMLISDEFLTDDICVTKEYKEYEKVFVRVDVPTIQPQPVKSTQGMIRTPSAQRTPTPTAIVGDVVHKKRKRKQVARDISSPKPSLKIRVKQMKPSTTPIHLRQENMVIAQEKLMKEDVEKIVDGDDEESYAKTIDDDEKEKENKDDKKDDENDDDNDDHTDQT